MAQRQVNVRIDDEDLEVLIAGGFIEGTSMTDEVRLAIQKRIDELRSDPDVAEVLRIQQERRARNEAPNVTPIRSPRARSSEGNE